MPSNAADWFELFSARRVELDPDTRRMIKRVANEVRDELHLNPKESTHERDDQPPERGARP